MATVNDPINCDTNTYFFFQIPVSNLCQHCSITNASAAIFSFSDLLFIQTPLHCVAGSNYRNIKIQAGPRSRQSLNKPGFEHSKAVGCFNEVSTTSPAALTDTRITNIAASVASLLELAIAVATVFDSELCQSRLRLHLRSMPKHNVNMSQFSKWTRE